MEVILKNQPMKNLTFSDVKEDQRFLNGAGNLCVKVTSEIYVALSDAEGFPYTSIHRMVGGDEPIHLILPEIEKYVLPKC